MDLGIFGFINFDLSFLTALFSIVIIDLILAGDNAVVIAMKEGAVNVIPVSEETPNPNAILTISREFGSGGKELGQAIARELGYEYVDRESILADIRKDGPIWGQWAETLNEHCPTVWEKYDWSFRGFADLVQWHILEHAERGGVVIVGRAGTLYSKACLMLTESA